MFLENVRPSTKPPSVPTRKTVVFIVTTLVTSDPTFYFEVLHIKTMMPMVSLFSP
jgi:hypothetical protein